MTFEELVAAQGQSLLRLAFVLTGARHLAEDLTENALADAYRHWRTVTAARDPAADLGDALAARQHMRVLLADLAPRARTVLVLRYYADLDDAAIAEAMGVSPSAVRATASRALASLRTTALVETVQEKPRPTRPSSSCANSSPPRPGCTPRGRPRRPRPAHGTTPPPRADDADRPARRRSGGRRGRHRGRVGPLGLCAHSAAAAPTGTGELPGGASRDCQGPSPVGLAAHLTEEGAFAFDGTVAGVEPGTDLGPEMPRQYAQETFRVQSWYHGGSDGTVDVLLDGPDTEDASVSAYGVGTRLLVSGVLASTERASRAPTATGDMAWFGFSCGYTRHHDEATAAEWAAIAVGELPAGPLPATGAASCSGYAPALVAGKDLALDGTVTAIGGQLFPQVPEDRVAYYSVTFEVHAWYRGGAGETVTLHMDGPSPDSPEGGSVERYAHGTRLLVSGVLSDVEGRGFIGQGCGFTRYYDEATAAEWAAATD